MRRCGRVGELGRPRGRGEGVEHELVGAGDPSGVAVAGLVVLVGDLERLELLGMGVLAEAVVVEAQVHRLGRGGVQPDGDGAEVAARAVHVELGGHELPEVAQAHPDPARGVAEVGVALAAAAGAGGDPGAVRGGALGERVAVRVRLARLRVPGGDEPHRSETVRGQVGVGRPSI